ncbi:UPF0182 family membrane protein [Salimicrobium humidisoli]|uniref:UPF0182 protein CKW00_02810 n=1 Tax=Salimicrobium humidisoli TaxID=2029857 RepID=A0ABX4HU69_9BACI|nr:UPF0182 family protein [Salimicrobium humidisoli]PBB06598.1 membrane protein [Salimicrobium humidisoli]
MDIKPKKTKNLTAAQKQKLNKAGGWLGKIFTVLFILAFIVLISFNWITDYIWMGSVGYQDSYMTILTSKLMLGVVGFILFAIFTYMTLSWIRNVYVGHFTAGQLPPFINNKKQSRLLTLVIAIIVGLLGSVLVQGVGWEPWLKFLNYESFGVKDPHFDRDVSFYMFVLPFIEFVLSIVLGLAIFFFLVEIGFYSVYNMYRMNRKAQMHMGITLAIIGILLAFQHVLEPFRSLLTNQVNVVQESVVHGLSYTDDVVNNPASYVMAGVALLGTIWVIVALFRGRWKSMVAPIILYIAVGVLAQGASMIVQNFVVSPNEFSKESPYLEESLSMTRTAYDLDNMTEDQHPGADSLDQSMVERNQDTINNVRINDARPILSVYNQLQTFRTYYEFNDIDIDRYNVDGEYEQVFLGARELNTEDLPSQAKTWVNQNLRYTHGYGISMSNVNEITPQGQPEYMVENLPPEGKPEVERPQVYFGEEDYDSVIVNSGVEEFDYPAGDENMSNTFEADSGVPLSGINRALFAINEGSFRMFVSDQVTGDSKILQTRNIMDRVERIAPFLTYDEDPYIFIREDGTMDWMIDAYVTEENYPYSEPYSEDNSYIRNSVKVTVDAYTGEVDFYAVNPEEPLLRTYQQIFPDLFTEKVPEDVKSHFRYPIDLFKIQAQMYQTYHMTNLEVFYNREDYWEIPTEKYFNEDITMEPYYVTMRLPEAEEEEFVLMTPFTPRNRQNMIAWMGVRNDGEHYGEKVVYEFPKQENVYGPQQIENRINQDSNISQQLNLWSQGGSEVIRGNLLVLPIEDTVLYAEPVYIESSNETSLPEVKQVIVAYQDQIVMEPTFDKALEVLLSRIDPEVEAPEEGGEDSQGEGQSSGLETNETLQEISDLFGQYQQQMSDGNYEEAGRIMEEIQSKLQSSQNSGGAGQQNPENQNNGGNDGSSEGENSSDSSGEE